MDVWDRKNPHNLPCSCLHSLQVATHLFLIWFVLSTDADTCCAAGFTWLPLSFLRERRVCHFLMHVTQRRLRLHCEFLGMFAELEIGLETRFQLARGLKYSNRLGDTLARQASRGPSKCNTYSCALIKRIGWRNMGLIMNNLWTVVASLVIEYE